MKPNFTSNFEYGRRMSKYCLIAAIILCLASVFMVPEGSTAQFILLLAATATIIAAFVVMYRNCRCPYCGKRIMAGVLVVTSCPRCRRSFTTGRKTKKR